MNLKRIISLMLSMTMILGMITYVHADAQTGIVAVANAEQTKVTVTGKLGDTEGLLTAIAFTPNGDVKDSKLFFTTFTKSQGAIEETVNIPSGFDSGIYRVIASNMDGKDTAQFVFSKTSDIEEVMGYMNGVIPEDYDEESRYIEAVSQVINDYPGKLGLDVVTQAGLFAKIGKVFAAHKGNKQYTDSSVFISEFNQCFAALLLNEGEDPQSVLNTYGQYMGEEVAKLNTYSRAVKDLILEDLKTVDYQKGLLSVQLPQMRTVAFFKASETWGSAKLNILGQDESGNTFIDNFAVLNPDTTYYNQLSSVNNVYKSLFDNRNSINTIEELCGLFEKFAFEAYEDEIYSDNGYSAPSGGSGGNRGVINNYSDKKDNADNKTVETQNESLTDISNHWAKNQIQSLYKKNIVSGYPDGTFKPQNNVSRAEFVKMIVSIGFDKFSESENKFTDVSENDWHYNYIMTAFANGVVNGTSENTFSPNEQITRQDAGVIIYNYLNPDIEIDVDAYPDDVNISGYAKDAVYALTALGVLTGYDNGNFEPKNSLTRAESAVLLSRILNISKDELSGYVSAEAQKKADELNFKYGVLTAANSDFYMDMEQETVSRGEFLNSLVGMMGETHSDTKVTFSDVAEDSKYYNSVAYAIEHGWLMGEDKFSPDSPATFEFAVKMGVHAIGAQDYAEISGYENVAQTNDFYEDIEDDVFSPEAACTLLYNIINSPTCIIDSTKAGNLNMNGQPVLEQIHKLYTFEDIFYANTRTDIQEERANRYKTLRIGKYEFFCDGNYDRYLGQNVRVLYEMEDDEFHIRFMAPYKNSVVEFNNHTFIDVKGSKVYYDENGRTKSFNINSDYTYVLNEKTALVTSSDPTALFSRESTNYKVIDNDNDGYHDVIIADSFVYTFVDKLDLYKGYIYDKFTNQGFIDLSGDDCEYQIYVLENGKMSEGVLQDIKEGSVIAHAASADNKYHKLIVCKDTVEGAIDTMTQNGNSVVTINDEDFYRSQYYITNYVTNFGTENIYYLGINNEIVSDEPLESAEQYAWFIKVYPRDLDLLEDNEPAYIKIFTQDGDVVSLPIAKKIRYDGVQSELRETVTSLCTIVDDADRVIKYKLNSNDEVVMIDTPAHRLNDITSFGKSYPADNALSLHFSGSFNARPKSIMYDKTEERAVFNYANTECIFVIPEEEDRDDDRKYKLISASEIDYHTNDSYPFNAYDVTPSGSASVLVRVLESGSGSGTATDWESLKYAVVGNATKVLNSDEEVVTQLSIHNGRAFITVYMDDYAVEEYGIPNPGDIIGYTVDSSNNIKTLVTAYDFLRYTAHSDVAVDNERISFTQGFLYSYANGYMYYFAPEMLSQYKPSCGGTVDTTTLRNLNITENYMIFVDVLRSSDGSEIKSVDIKAESIANMAEYKNSNPEDVTYVVNLTEYVGGNTTFAYQISYEEKYACCQEAS